MSFSDLPLLFDLLQPYTCKTARPDSPCSCAYVEDQTKSKPPIPDKRLLNWEQWMKKRKHLHQKLGTLLKREPGGLVMNTAEEFRTVKEEKLALEYTKILEPDPQRGCPIGKLPPSFKNACGIETYFAVPTKEDRCEVPVLEHVGLSAHILEEKDVLPRIRNPQETWSKLPYLQHRKLELSRRLQQVDPYHPDYSALCIKGVQLDVATNSTEQQPDVLCFSEAKTPQSPETVITEQEGLPSKLCLSVNNFQLSPDLQISGTRKVYITFEYDTNQAKVATEYLTLKNLGSTTIRFYWKMPARTQYFKDLIVDTSHETYFYFNKNEGLIMPGQTIEFPIWFKTKEPGTYYEQWQFYTKPNVMPSSTILLIIFHASAVIGDIHEKIEKIREQLNKNIRDRLIKEAIATVVSNVSSDNSKPTVYYYNKREVFETVNSDLNPFQRRSKYLYNKDVVRELQRFYKNVRRPSDPKYWNYYIDELRLLTRAKQREEETHKKVIASEESKKLFEGSPKRPRLTCTKTVFPTLSGINEKLPNKPKISTIPELPTELNQSIKSTTNEKPTLEMPLTEQLEFIISKLERATVDNNKEETKYTQVYLILCTYFSKIGSALEDLKYRLGIIKKTNYPKFLINDTSHLYNKPNRLVYEMLDDVLEGPSLICKVGTKTDRPAAEVLKDIPKEDSKRRYKTYYNIPDTPPINLGKDKKGKPSKTVSKTDKKTEKSKDKKSDQVKGKKTDLKPTKIDSDEDDKYIVNEMFDPYAEINLPIVQEQFMEEANHGIESNFDQISQTVHQQYKYNLYVLMYNYLNQAILTIVDMIEMQPRENLPYPVIKEFEELKYNRRLIDLKGLLAEEDIQSFKASLVLYKYRKQCKKNWKTLEIHRQLQHTKSDSSLWSILRTHQVKSKLPEEKPISYPIDHYDNFKKMQVDSSWDDHCGQDQSCSDSQLALDISTSTVFAKIDPSLENFKDMALQKDYNENDKPDDLEEHIEKIISKISTQDLIDFKLVKAMQKRSSEHVSDEEYFYDSESDGNIGFLSESSVESEIDYKDIDKGSCSCEGFGICNLLVGEHSHEEYEEDNLPFEEECSCEGLGECNLSLSTQEFNTLPVNKQLENPTSLPAAQGDICEDKCTVDNKTK